MLAVLIRLGDSLDADRRRCNNVNETISQSVALQKQDVLSTVSKAHYWKHYYLSNVIIKNSRILLEFRIPKGYKNVLSGILYLATHCIEMHIEDLKKVWENYDIRIACGKPDVRRVDLNNKNQIPSDVRQYFIDNPGDVDWIKEFVEGYEDEEISVLPDEASPGSTQTKCDRSGSTADTNIKGIVRNNIIPLLKNVDEEFTNDLKRELESNYDTVNGIDGMAAELIEEFSSFDSTRIRICIQCYIASLAECFRNTDVRDKKTDIYKKVEDILGWLLLLLVDYSWLSKNIDLFAKNEGHFNLSLTTGVGTAIVVSCFRVMGKNGINHNLAWKQNKKMGICDERNMSPDSFFNSDFKTGNIVENLKKEIWSRVALGLQPPRNGCDFNSQLILKLQNMLSIHKKQPYITIDSSENTCDPLYDNDVLAQLQKDLENNLKIIIIGKTNDSINLIFCNNVENILQTCIHSFLELKP